MHGVTRGLVSKILVKLLSLRLNGPPPKLDPAKITSILVFGMPSIGNTLLSVPMFVALRARFPNATIAIGYRDRRPGETILSSLKLVEHVFYFDTNNLRNFVIGAIQALAFKPDIVIRPFFCVDGFTSILLITNARHRVGHVASDGWPGGYDNLLNLPVSMMAGQHESEHYLALSRALGCLAVEDRPSFPFDFSDHLRVDAWLQARHVSSNDLIISIHPGSSPGQMWKRWPTEKWVMLIDRLVKVGFYVIILGDHSERDLIDPYQFAFGRVLSAVGAFNLTETAALLNRSRLLVCNDSGLGHLAHYLKCKVIILFGPTDAVRTGPIDGKTVVSRGLPCQPCYNLGGDAAVKACGHHACLRQLDIDKVTDEIDKYLEDA